jgi:hypothetical protein
MAFLTIDVAREGNDAWWDPAEKRRRMRAPREAGAMSEPAFTQHVAQLVRKIFWRRPSATGSVVMQAGGQAIPAGQEAAFAGQTIVASRLQMIGLARVKSALGDRWPALAEKVRGIAQHIIEKHLLPGDACEQHGEDGFLVLFPQLSPGDAKFKSDAICHEIERRLIGENMADVSKCVAEISVMGPAESFLGPQPAASGAVIEGEDGGNAIAEKLKKLRRRSDYARKYPDGESPESENPGGPPSEAGGSGRKFDSAQHSESAIVMVPIVKDGVPKEDGALGRRHSDMEWLYRPVWDFKNATLIMFALYPQRANAGGETNGDLIADVDTAAVWKCVHDLQALSASGRRLPLLSRIHYGTIDNPRRRAFFSGTVRNIPAEFRKLISFEIVGCPHGGLNFGIAGFIASLRQNGVRVALGVDAKWPDFLAAERAGTQIVTMDTFEHEGPESERMVAFEIFAARTANAKLEAAMWGLGTRSLVVAAASAGIRYLAGGAVAPSMANLSHAVRFSPIDLYPHA